MSKPTLKLTRRQNDIWEWIRSVEITSPRAVQCRKKVARVTLDRLMDKLHHGGLIYRPQKGLIITCEYVRNNPEDTKWIESCIGYEVRQ